MPNTSLYNLPYAAPGDPADGAGNEQSMMSATELAVRGQLAYVTSNQTFTSTTTLANVTQIVLPVAANATYRFELFLNYGALAAAGIKIGWTVPAAASMVWTWPEPRQLCDHRVAGFRELRRTDRSLQPVARRQHPGRDAAGGDADRSRHHRRYRRGPPAPGRADVVERNRFRHLREHAPADVADHLMGRTGSDVLAAAVAASAPPDTGMRTGIVTTATSASGLIGVTISGKETFLASPGVVHPHRWRRRQHCADEQLVACPRDFGAAVRDLPGTPDGRADVHDRRRRRRYHLRHSRHPGERNVGSVEPDDDHMHPERLVRDRRSCRLGGERDRRPGHPYPAQQRRCRGNRHRTADNPAAIAKAAWQVATTIIELSAGDTLSVSCSQNSGGNLTTSVSGIDQPSFSVFPIS